LTCYRERIADLNRSDQTTRLYAEWKRGQKHSWHEFARPQIHGYDLNCIDSLGSSQFISGADEKLLRVFDEPKTIARLLERLCDIKESRSEELPDAANIPVLGLSNKAIQAVNDDQLVMDGIGGAQEVVDPNHVVYSSNLDLDHPPLEDHLARHTLWPEREKLYGHGYEISAVTTSYDGGLVATACKASSIDHAVIRLFETKDWHEVKPPLVAHSLTVTSLCFSRDDRYLLSVGRDRQWTVFEQDTNEAVVYKLSSSNPKGHSRMILGAAWAPVQAGRIFATAGRDKLVSVVAVNIMKESESYAGDRAGQNLGSPGFCVRLQSCNNFACTCYRCGFSSGSC
jgi:elongator complex protein 2